MPRPGNYGDITGAEYWERINGLTDQYRALRAKAERARHENGGRPCEEEARFWGDAAKRCEEILSVGMNERNLRIQWEERLRDAKTHLKDIVDAIAPPKKKDLEKTPQFVDSKSTAAADSRGYVTTPSGFKTRNAVPNVVSADTIESWYQKPDPDPDHKKSLDQVIGMQEVKDRLKREVASMGWDLTDKVMGINPVQAYFFYGPSGGGKTFLIDSFANEMMNQGFNYIKVKGSEILSSYVGESEKIVDAVFKEAIDASPCILFIDEVDAVCTNRNGTDVKGHEKKLTNAFLESRTEMFNSGVRVVFFGGTNRPWDVDPAMIAAAKLIRFPLPDEEARRGFFEKKFKQYVLEDGFTVNDMVEATDNCDYHELSEKLVPAILNSVKQELIEANWVFDEAGNRNKEETDKKVAALVESKTVVLRREIFDRERKALNLPSDKTETRERLLAFEKRAEA